MDHRTQDFYEQRGREWADVLPSTAKLVYSLQGEKLGCDIDKSSGVVKIGSTAC